MPITIANWYRLTNVPRIFAGEISEMYKGESIEAAPIPKPPINLANTNCVRLAGIAAPSDEMIKSSAVIIKTFFLPILSLKYPAPIAPNTQPQIALLAAQPIIAVDNWNL